jgi:putative ABC transport system permease protein
MDLREHLLQVYESISTHPKRVIASSLGVFWGAAAIIVMLAWGTGFRTYMYGELQRYGRPMLFFSPGITSSGFPGFRAGVRVTLSREDAAVAEASNAELIEAILPEHLAGDAGRVRVQVGNRVHRMDLSGVDHRFAYYRKFAIGSGRFFDATDVARERALAVLGFEAAEELFGSAPAAVGKRMRIEGQAFTVIGVSDQKGRQYFNNNRPDNRLLMVPITTSEIHFGYREDEVERYSIFPRPGVAAEPALEAVVSSLAPRIGFHPEDTDAFRWFDLSSLLRMIDLFYIGFLVFIGVAGTVTLLVAGVGIANFHLATLAERTVEIGVAKALGARNRVLVTQTVLESLAVSGFTAFLGVSFGLLACVALDVFTPPGVLPTPILSAPVVVITAVALIAVALVAAVIPAIRIRGMEIAAAVRAGL